VASKNASSAGIAQRYAGALYELANPQWLDAVAADLKTFEAALDASPDLKRLTLSPLLARAAQEKAVLAVAASLGIADLVRRFVGTLARNRRLGSFPAIAKEYRALLAEARGETVAEIVSAAPLSAARQAELEAKLRAAAGRKVTLDLKVDPKLLGGLKVKVGSRLVDASLQGQLKRLHLSLAGRA
jgi:F-type H+-transporting ATPase subunit delta